MASANFGPVPAWGADGLLPPLVGNPAGLSNHSPYHVSLMDLVSVLGRTDARRDLLDGLLNYRAALHQAGLLQGVQWVNGSFVENTTPAGREPQDIDVVTFYRLPDGYTQEIFSTAFPSLLEMHRTGMVKARYGIDAYVRELNFDNIGYMVKTMAYWNSLWSHTREDFRKGYLQVGLADDEDAAARAALNQAMRER